MTAEPESGKLRVAIVGAGRMAREHLKAFGSIAGGALAGIFSRTAVRAEKLVAEFGVELVCDDIESLYDQTRADLVVVAVSITASKRVAEGCLDFPWAVLLEKPPGLNLREARDLSALASRKGRDPFVGLNRRYFGSTKAVLQALESSPGNRFISVLDQEDRDEAVAAGHPREVVNYWMYANAIHVIDYFSIFGRGEIIGVHPIIKWDVELKTQQVVAADIKFDSGDRGLYQAIWNGPGPWGVTVNVGDKRWELRPLEEAGLKIRGERRSTSLDFPVHDANLKPGFREQAIAVIEAIRGLRSNAVTLSESLKTMELIGKIYQM